MRVFLRTVKEESNFRLSNGDTSPCAFGERGFKHSSLIYLLFMNFTNCKI